MRNTKHVLRIFTVPEYEKEAVWLTAMQLKSVQGNMFYTFERTEPEDVIYRLDYNAEANKDIDSYRQIFADCGWTYVTGIDGFHYFRKSASAMQKNEAPDIFSDNESRLDMCRRIWRGRMIPLLILLCAIFIPNAVSTYSELPSAEGFTLYGDIFIFCMSIIVIIVYAYIFIRFAVNWMRMTAGDDAR